MAYGNFVTCINRTTRRLEGTFDGQVVVLEPGYVDDGTGKIVRAVDGHGAPVVTMLPSNVAAIIKSQNPVMGTQDISSPSPDEYLIGIEKWSTGRKDDVSHREQSDAIEIIDRETVADDRRVDSETIKGKGRRTRGNVAVATKTLVRTDVDD